MFGQVAARGVFATLQSAAMGGYGVAAVNGVVSIASAGTGILAGLWSRNKTAEDVVVEVEGDGDDDEGKDEKDVETRSVDTYGEGKPKVNDDVDEKAKL